MMFVFLINAIPIVITVELLSCGFLGSPELCIYTCWLLVEWVRDNNNIPKNGKREYYETAPNNNPLLFSMLPYIY